MTTNIDLGRSDRPQQSADDLYAAPGGVRSLIISLAGSFSLLVLLAVAAWIVMAPGAGHAPW